MRKRELRKALEGAQKALEGAESETAHWYRVVTSDSWDRQHLTEELEKAQTEARFWQDEALRLRLQLKTLWDSNLPTSDREDSTVEGSQTSAELWHR